MVNAVLASVASSRMMYSTFWPAISVGKKSNADGIGAVVRIFYGGEMQSRMVRGGSSYLSQSELVVTFGVGRQDWIERVVIDWPSGRSEEFKNLATGRAYECTEMAGIKVG